jgi:hypothetical protein
MRSFVVSSAVLLVVCAFSSGNASAQATFKDSICPEATHAVIEAGKVRKTDPPQRIYDAAQSAVNQYEQCSKDKLSNGFREAQHYADTRASGFAVVAARALVALDRLADARSLLQKWRPYAQQVVDWQSETMAFQSADVNGFAVTKESDHRPSMYRAAAREIVAAVDDELALIALLSRDLARPQAQQSPAAVASPKP